MPGEGNRRAGFRFIDGMRRLVTRTGCVIRSATRHQRGSTLLNFLKRRLRPRSSSGLSSENTLLNEANWRGKKRRADNKRDRQRSRRLGTAPMPGATFVWQPEGVRFEPGLISESRKPSVCTGSQSNTLHR